VPGILSKSTVSWAAEHRYPYVMLDSKLELTRQTFDYYDQQAKEFGFEAGSQHHGYMFKICVDETEELAYETGRKMIEGSGNVFLDGSNGSPNPWAMNLPGFNSRDTSNFLPTADFVVQRTRGILTDKDGKAAGNYDAPAATQQEHDQRRRKIFDGLLERHACIVGTPTSIIPKIRHILEQVRPGNIFFWHGDGDFTHEETVRGVRLLGEYVLPQVREMAKEMELKGAFEVDPATNQPVEPVALAV
jgi:alkanesulfonate monooxygenase SsuD/methylene tetrahydromethanopterin reductase-like flavin-dependent oxidoreductase (luciferase family)